VAGQSEIKSCALAEARGFHPDAAAVKFHDAPHQRQADARAFGARVQLVEQAENGFVKTGSMPWPWSRTK
jgi:hypothetical protein